MKNQTLSIIIPAYNEEKSISKICHRIAEIMGNNRIPYEIIFVNDGSVDGSWDEIRKQNEENHNIFGVSFSRNFGKEQAIRAGLVYASGGCAVVIDADLQHPPEKIPEMYREWQNGYEIVEGIKISRGKEPFLHSIAAKTFYRIMSRLIRIDVQNSSDFKLIDRSVINVLLSMDEKSFFFRALSSDVGFKKTKVEFDVMDREDGESKWSAKSLVIYAINNITAFSTAPLQCSILFLLITMLFTIGCAIIMCVSHNLSLLPFLLLSLCLAMVFANLSVLGYYIGKMYEELKDRPNYIIRDTTETR